jgi:hypothetical protein
LSGGSIALDEALSRDISMGLAPNCPPTGTSTMLDELAPLWVRNSRDSGRRRAHRANDDIRHDRSPAMLQRRPRKHIDVAPAASTHRTAAPPLVASQRRHARARHHKEIHGSEGVREMPRGHQGRSPADALVARIC